MEANRLMMTVTRMAMLLTALLLGVFTLVQAATLLSVLRAKARPELSRSVALAWSVVPALLVAGLLAAVAARGGAFW